MDKKGDISFLLEFIPNIIYTFVAFLVLVTLILYFADVEVEVSDVRQQVTLGRILYSPDTIAYVDPVTQRSYPGIVDLDRVTNENLDRAINYDEKKQVAAKVIVQDKLGNPVKVAYLNQRWYETWSKYVQQEIEGPGSATMLERRYPVLYKSGEEERNGWLLLEIVTPNT